MKKQDIGVLVTCCCMIASTIGILTNGAGVFFTPIADDFGVGRGAVSLTLTISNVAYAIGGLFTVKWLHNNNFKRMMTIFALIYGITTSLLGLCTSVVSMYVLNVFRGFSTGVVGMVLVTILINNHIHSNVGLATSIALAFSGLSGAVFSPLFTSIINSIGWRMTYVFLGVFAFVLYLPCILGPMGMGNKEVVESNASSKEVSSNTKVPFFIFLIVAAYILACSAGTALPQHFPSMIENGSVLVSICMITNTGSKVLFGIMADKIGTVKSLLVYGVLACLGLGCLIVSKEMVFWMVGATFVGFIYAMSAVGGVLFSREVFQSEYDTYYPKIALIGTLSNAALTTCIGLMYDIFHSYIQALVLLLVFMVISLVCVVICSKTKSKNLVK